MVAPFLLDNDSFGAYPATSCLVFAAINAGMPVPLRELSVNAGNAIRKAGVKKQDRRQSASPFPEREGIRWQETQADNQGTVDLRICSLQSVSGCKMHFE